jgi:hypothetical protein
MYFVHPAQQALRQAGAQHEEDDAGSVRSESVAKSSDVTAKVYLNGGPP